MVSPACFLCGDRIRRQLGFNAGGLTAQNRQVLKFLRRSWSNSLFTLLNLTDSSCQTALGSVPYCMSCHQIIFDVEFVISTMSKLERRLDHFRSQVKGLLLQCYEKSPLYRGLIGQLLSFEDLEAAGIDAENGAYVDDCANLTENDKKPFSSDPLDDGEHYEEVELQKVDDEDDNEDWLWLPPSARTNTSEKQQRKTCLQSRKRKRAPGKPETFPCTVCEEVVTGKIAFRRHMLLHTDPEGSSPRKRKRAPSKPKTFSCLVCEEVVTGQIAFRRHMKELHPPDSKVAFKCRICIKSFDSENEVKQHEGLHEALSSDGINPFLCVLCPAKLISQYDLEKHVLAEHETNVFKCDQCTEVRTSAEKLRCHKKRAHLEGVTKMYNCSECSYQAIFPSMIRTHARFHSEKSYQCDIDNCSAKFYLQSQLNFHQRKSHGADGKLYACNLCPRTFVRKLLLKYHQMHHSNLRPFMCEVCSLTFKSDNNLRTHLRNTHSENKVTGDNLKLRQPRKARLSVVTDQMPAALVFQPIEKPLQSHSELSNVNN